MHLETDSFLGPTVNPYNRTLTAGGSSGGEGALIGMKGSVLGCVAIRGLSKHCQHIYRAVLGQISAAVFEIRQL
jgi:hypothetical protein